MAGAGRLPRGVPTRADSFRDAARFLLAPVPSPLARSFLDRADRVHHDDVNRMIYYAVKWMLFGGLIYLVFF